MHRPTDLHAIIDQIHVSALQYLMTGHVADFRRIFGPLLDDGVLESDTCRVYIARGPAAERDQVLAACREAVHGTALVTRCPIYDSDVIVVAPLPARAITNGWDLTGLRLRTVTDPRPSWHLGGSGISTLTHTAQAYGDASNALLSARYLTERAALHSSDIRLVHILGGRAQAWAANLLEPLHHQAENRRDLLTDTASLALAFNHSAVATLLRTSRGVVTNRMKRIGGILGLRLTEFQDRAILDLALAVDARADCGPPSEFVALADLLSTPDVRTWAASLLGRLDTDNRPLRRTVIAWLTHNGHVTAAAEALTLRDATVRTHLKAAEALLHRRLLGSLPESEPEMADRGVVGSGEVFLAAAVLGEVPVPEWPTPGFRM
ncbi:hypothetical protein ACFXDE_02250 [Kitasatospora sp. NPDC059408]|uniref:hypothetical protein n=1 Tax=Kitasatospora sp. NPDC059408 TaxID=3346823 RepID=UPI0036BD6DE1